MYIYYYLFIILYNCTAVSIPLYTLLWYNIHYIIYNIYCILYNTPNTELPYCIYTVFLLTLL